jgi:hypothetical protein
MVRTLSLAALAAVLLATCPVLAEPTGTVVPFVERPLVITEGVGEIGGDLVVGLDKGAEGQLVGLWSPFPGNRHAGLFVRYGFARRIEAGLSIPYQHVSLRDDLPLSYTLAVQGWPLRRDLSTQHHFGPVAIWGRFGLAPWAAVEIAVLVPVEKLRDNRAAGRVSLPLRWTVIPGTLVLHVEPDITIGFGRPDANLDTSVQISFYGDAGITWNVIPEVWLDLSLAFGRMISPGPAGVLRDWPSGNPSGTGVLPVGLTVGWTVLPSLDLTAGFALTNLLPGEGGAADARALSVGVRYRF